MEETFDFVGCCATSRDQYRRQVDLRERWCMDSGASESVDQFSFWITQPGAPHHLGELCSNVGFSGLDWHQHI